MNKKTKKIILIIISLILAVTLLTFGTIKVVKYVKNYVGDTKVYLNSQAGIPGDTVKVPLSIIKNHGLWAGIVKIKYDTSALEFVSCANGEVFDECEVEANNGTVSILVNMSGTENVKENGIIATVNFVIKGNASVGDYVIQFDDGTAFCNIEAEEKEVVLEKGNITVK